MSAKRPPVVLFYDHTAALSGGEISLLHLVTNLHTERYTPVVVLGEDGPLKNKLEAAGIETHILPLDSGIRKTSKDSLGSKGILLKLASAGRMWTYIWKLSRFMRRHQTAVVHTNSLKSDIIGGLAGRLARRPVIWHVRDCIDTDYLPGAAVKIFRAACRRIPHHVIAISKAVQDTLLLPESKRVTVVHNGVSTVKQAEPQDSGAPIVGLVGRITRWKGQHIFIQAAAKLKPKFPEVRYRIIGAPLFGEHQYEAEIHELVEALDLKTDIEFLGFRTDIPEMMAELTVLAHASTSAEPFGKVVIEAMIAGKPVVATKGGGIPDIVLDGETGYLVPMGDVDALAQRIEDLLTDPVQARAMGQAGRQRVLEHFTIEQTVRGVEAVYDEVLKKR